MGVPSSRRSAPASSSARYDAVRTPTERPSTSPTCTKRPGVSSRSPSGRGGGCLPPGPRSRVRRRLPRRHRDRSACARRGRVVGDYMLTGDDVARGATSATPSRGAWRASTTRAGTDDRVRVPARRGPATRCRSAASDRGRPEPPRGGALPVGRPRRPRLDPRHGPEPGPRAGGRHRRRPRRPRWCARRRGRGGRAPDVVVETGGGPVTNLADVLLARGTRHARRHRVAGRVRDHHVPRARIGRRRVSPALSEPRACSPATR